MTVATRPATNGKRRPVEIAVERSELVGRLMDAASLAAEAITANGASLQTVQRLPAGPWRTEMQMAHHFTHDRLTALLSELRTACGVYDKSPVDGA